MELSEESKQQRIRPFLGRRRHVKTIGMYPKGVPLAVNVRPLEDKSLVIPYPLTYDTHPVKNESSAATRLTYEEIGLGIKNCPLKELLDVEEMSDFPFIPVEILEEFHLAGEVVLNENFWYPSDFQKESYQESDKVDYYEQEVFTPLAVYQPLPDNYLPGSIPDEATPFEKMLRSRGLNPVPLFIPALPPPPLDESWIDQPLPNLRPEILKPKVLELPEKDLQALVSLQSQVKVKKSSQAQRRILAQERRDALNQGYRLVER